MVHLNAVIVYIALSAIVGYLGRKRSIGFAGFFILSVLLSPLVMALILLGTKPNVSSRLSGPVN
jgi:hypothetical protein